ncbi:type I restriction enzyme S subunit [Sphaerotilus sulfidivorans]|uniref:Restriction endonuclease subunit S n=1 Tax=Sphaerotilus sulfidivorans TaxID=639200 RepID=A0A5C1PYN9_9BURK|nr:restriction endonuclease subunit S [Sphaerotilus sulfidivorans]NZD47319.1 restriction endonuclease subunit S [Sphaerotilus sulfidivorans]QEM99759.1 restriction endonuclease subunit S [Sphaerotilus sulfidivorans]
MQSEWAKPEAISELLARHGGSIKTGPFGTTLKASEYASVGVPLISVREIGHGSFHVDAKTPRVDAATLARLPEYILEEGDIVFARKGGIERCALVRKQQAGWFLGSDGIRLRPPKVCDARFLAYSLQTQAVKDWLVQHSTGSTMASLNQSTIGRLPVAFPSVSTQRAVADTLEFFDDRIDLLRQTNATLESIAQALFKSWFIDFDPVRAKAEGREPLGLDAATAALFPAEFEESALGVIPKGWTVQPIGDLVETVGGSTPDTKNEAFWEPAAHHWTSPKDLSGATAPVLLGTERKVSAAGLAKISSGLLPVGTLLMSSRAPIGYLSLTQVPVAINQGYIAMPPGGRLPPEYMYFWCQHNMDAIKGRANGSTFMEISKKAFRPIPSLLPALEVIARFTDFAAMTFERITMNERQALALVELRNTLLPRLISGKLRLPEAQEQLADVLA